MTHCLTVLALGVLATGLAGCIEMSRNIGLPNPFEVSRPYEGRHRNLLAVRGIAQSASITVFPVAALPPGWGQTIAKNLEQAGQLRDIPVLVDNNAETADQLMGRARLESDSKGLWLEVRWQHLGPDGTFIEAFKVREKLAEPGTMRFTGLSSPWDLLNRERAYALAERTADRLQRRLEIAQGRDPGRSFTRNRIVLRPVSGAPGDGGKTLTVSLARMLAEAQFDVDTRWQAEDAPVPFGAVVVLGEVEVTTLDTGVDRVDLIWTVLDHRAQWMGEIKQTNTVPRGTLDESWGEVAVYAAHGAKEGILGLLAHMPMAPRRPPSLLNSRGRRGGRG
ncbi:MAG: hypothetical protein ACFB6R_11840 [Alphaproteobacteria bacterium]